MKTENLSEGAPFFQMRLLFCGNFILIAVTVIGTVCAGIVQQSRVLIFIEIHFADPALPVLIIRIICTGIAFVHHVHRFTKYSSYHTRKV